VYIFLNEGATMPTNLAIDDKLIENARRIGKHKTKKAVVTEALIEYIQRREQLKILGLFGTIDYDTDYDYKDQRKRN
jgi:Arc/MetJ family transcription regulator